MSEMWKIKLQKIAGDLSEKLRKLYMNGNSHLEIFIFSRPKVIGNSRQYLLLVKDILQKTVAFLFSGSYFCAEMNIFSNFIMFVKQILKDWYLKSSINLKNCNSSYFLSYTVQFANSLRVKWNYPVCLGTRIAWKVSKQLLADHLMYREEGQISDSKRKKPDS